MLVSLLNSMYGIVPPIGVLSIVNVLKFEANREMFCGMVPDNLVPSMIRCFKLERLGRSMSSALPVRSTLLRILTLSSLLRLANCDGNSPLSSLYPILKFFNFVRLPMEAGIVDDIPFRSKSIVSGV
jgi:hypothetical protein